MPDAFDPLEALSPIDLLRMRAELEGRYATPAEMAQNRQGNRAAVIDMLLGGRTAAEMGQDVYQAGRDEGMMGAGREAGLAGFEAAMTALGAPGSPTARNAAREGADTLNVLIAAPGGRAADRALDMRQSGVENRKIFEDTGLFFGHEGRLRKEVPDAGMTIDARGASPGDMTTLGDAARHDELFDLMPQLRDVPVRWTDKVDMNKVPIARTEPGTGVFEINPAAQDLRPHVAKLMQYRIGEQSGFGTPVRHGYDKIRNDIDTAIAMATGAPGADVAQQAAYLRMLQDNKRLMAETARNVGGDRGLAMADHMMGARSSGNIDARIVKGRAAVPGVESRYPYSRNAAYLPRRSGNRIPQFEDAMVLPPPGATRDEIADFLANWQMFGSGRGP